MKQIVRLFFFLLLAQSSLAAQTSVAVYPIKAAGTDSSLAAAMTALLTSKLTPSPYLRVIEEAALNVVMERQAINQSDLCDDTVCQVEIGKLVQAQKLIRGDLAKFGNKYILSLKLVDVRTGAVEFSTEDSCSCPEDQLDQLVAVAAAKVRNHFGEALPIPVLSSTPAISSAPPPPAPEATPGEGQATLYIVRPSNLLAASVQFTFPFKVRIDGKEFGQTYEGKYLMAKLAPGTHEIESKAENRATVSITVEAGKKYYVQQKVTMGAVSARNKLVILSPEEGQKALSKCELSKRQPNQ